MSTEDLKKTDETKVVEETKAPEVTTPKVEAKKVGTAEPKPSADKPKVTDYAKLKARNVVEAIIDTGRLPKREDLDILLDIDSENGSPVYHTQKLVKCLLDGQGIPPVKSLEKLLLILVD